MIAFPNAKINIGLNIVRRRSDGYHDIETVFYPIAIRDAIEVAEAERTSIDLSGILVPGSPGENLCLKAYQLISADYTLPPVHIHLHKNIPIGAGLGGGSADGAFFIKLLNTKFQLGFEIPQMENYARQLGADCAFFLHNKPMYAFEKGDSFEDISVDLSAYYIVLLMPPVHISTSNAYNGIKPVASTVSLTDLITLPLTEWKHHIKNDFENTCFNQHPKLLGIKNALYEHGALYASMSGSGASIYGIFESKPSLSWLEKEYQVFLGI